MPRMMVKCVHETQLSNNETKLLNSFNFYKKNNIKSVKSNNNYE